MKKIIIVITLIFMLKIELVAIEEPEYIKIGLRSQYYDKDECIIKNSKLKMYYEDNTRIKDFETDTSFLVKLSNRYYIYVKEEFNSFEEAMNISNKYNTGIPVYVGNKKWKVYVGGYTTIDEAEGLLDLAKSRNPNMEHGVLNKNNDRIEIYNQKRTRPFLIIDSSEDKVLFKTDEFINLETNSYRGFLTFRKTDEGYLLSINKVKFNDYLKGVVPAEMIAGANIEALKVQAISAKTYALKNINRRIRFGYNLFDTTIDQAYKGQSQEREETNKAVEAVDGEYLTYDGKLITTYYSAGSGGYTEDILNVWSGDPNSDKVKYLKAVEDKYEVSPIWEREYTKAFIESNVSDDKSVGRLESIIAYDYTDSGRATKLKVSGNDGEILIEKDRIRSYFPIYYDATLGKRRLKSTRFFFKLRDGLVGLYAKSDSKYNNVMIKDMKIKDREENNDSIYVLSADGEKVKYDQYGEKDKYVVQGTGFGHGVGMSQRGAAGMALAGFNYKEILTHYYSDTEIINIKEKE